MKKIKLKKINILILTTILLINTSIPVTALAQEHTPPEIPTAPIISDTPPETPDAPSIPQAPDQHQTPDSTSDSPPPANSNDSNNTNQNDAKSSQESERELLKKTAKENFIANINSQPSGNQSGTTTSPSNTSDTAAATDTSGANAIKTGNINTTSTAITTANTNHTTATPGNSAGISGPSLSSSINNSNGAISDNAILNTSENNNITTQTNSARINNYNDQNQTTGNNQSSYNNGDSMISTGDSNLSATSVTNANSNIDGLVIAEFNVMDDQRGDIVLDANAFIENCVSGCSNTSLSNTNNGALSQNTIQDTSSTNNTVFQNNDTSLGNTMILTSDTGNNSADFNTNGDSTIYTGDANISANSLTFLNNNVEGALFYGIINIYGNLEGNIILPDFTLAQNSAPSEITNSENGALSGNSNISTTSNNDNTFQYNDASITNNIIIDANTGNNDSSGNTSSDSVIKTGQSYTDTNVINIANSNINSDSAPMWLVIINEAGKWFGKLIGQPDGQNIASSDGLLLDVDQNGEITVGNNANGAQSQNSISGTTDNNKTIEQNNTAVIENNLHLTTNTGNNSTSYNTGGNNTVVTGDSNIIANMVNFVNNNIIGNGKLIIAVVNVFGSWMGDFVTPGQQKEKYTEPETQTAIQTSQDSDAKKLTEKTQDYAVTPDNSRSEQGIVASVSRFAPTKKSDATNTKNTPAISYQPFNSASVKDANTLDKSKLVSMSRQNALDNIQEKTNSISVNLAWFILIIPVLALIGAGRLFLKNRSRLLSHFQKISR